MDDPIGWFGSCYSPIILSKIAEKLSLSAVSDFLIFKIKFTIITINYVFDSVVSHRPSVSLEDALFVILVIQEAKLIF